MVHLIKRWEIVVHWDNEIHPFRFYIFDDHFHNVLTKLGSIQFATDPKSVTIVEEEDRYNTTITEVSK